MVVIENGAGRLSLRAPYHPDLALRARALAGRFRGAEQGWQFDLDREDELRRACMNTWGVDGTPEACVDTVTVRIEVRADTAASSVRLANNDNLWVAGREIVSRVRGKPIARAGRGVRFVEGAPQIGLGGGCWWVWVPAGATLLLRNVPRMAVARLSAVIGGQGSLAIEA